MIGTYFGLDRRFRVLVCNAYFAENTHPLRIQTTVSDDEVKGVVHESAVAAVVLRSVAVHQLLLGELQQFASLDRVDALGGARRREGPA
jgi:hypothetical protein